MKKTVYLSGPISNIIGNNFSEFAKAQEKIEALGFNVLNPHEICRFIDPEQYADKQEYLEACMRECLSKLPYAHFLITLKDWEESAEAVKEVAIARETGFIEVYSIFNFIKKNTDELD